MSESADNLVLEQLRLIRSDIRQLDEKLSERIDGLEAKVDGHTGILVALGRYLHDIDNRVEHLERSLGSDA
jgi:hypothetical protein